MKTSARSKPAMVLLPPLRIDHRQWRRIETHLERLQIQRDATEWKDSRLPIAVAVRDVIEAGLRVREMEFVEEASKPTDDD